MSLASVLCAHESRPGWPRRVLEKIVIADVRATARNFTLNAWDSAFFRFVIQVGRHTVKYVDEEFDRQIAWRAGNNSATTSPRII